MSTLPGTLEVRYDLCTGCRACQVACAIQNEGLLWLEAARIRVLQVGPGPLDVPVYCHQCSDHPCVAACPPKVKALSCDPGSGVVKVDPALCLRSRGAKCRRCYQACPAGAINFHPATGLPLFCHLCDGHPACVTACGPGALSYISGSSFDSKVYARRPETMVDDLTLKIYGRFNAG
ncbi:4Fe-4S dicluster domain-containing protein [Moorella stamsii]|nr:MULTISPECIES: 4Fe-4S dicluster domain-containing protein [Moorella]